MRYRKRPVEVEARQWAGGEAQAMSLIGWIGDNGGSAGLSWDLRYQVDPSTVAEHRIAIETLEGITYASPGDWIIMGVQGEFYACKPDIFAATYEQVT